MTPARLSLRVLELLGTEARLAWTLALANVALATAQFAEPVLFGRVVDALAAAQAGGTAPTWTGLAALLGAWGAFALFSVVCGTLIAMHASRLARRRRHAAATAYFEHALQLPVASQGSPQSGRPVQAMLDGADSLWWLWLRFFREHLAGFVTLFAMLPLALFVNWRLALLLIVLCVLFAALSAPVLRRADAAQRPVARREGDVVERTTDALGNVALVQSFSRIDAEVAGLRNVVGNLLGTQMPALSWWAICAVLARASTMLSVVAIVIVGIWFNMRGNATVGEIVTFTLLAGSAMGRLEQSVGFVHRLLLDRPRLVEFFEALDTVPAVRDRPDAIDPGRVRGLVEFGGVSYSHDGKRAAVADLAFTALPGELVALVGSSGSGKSTVLSLLHRAIDPQSGAVKIDGMDIRGIALSALRRNVGAVTQDALLFNRSIADNLRIGDPDATDEELRETAARARALDFIEALPEGFETTAGERGRLLGGGERQRIAIARVLLKDPPIAIVDEATGALDPATELQVHAALDEALKERTVIVIARRLSTLRKAARILMLENGRVVETGTFDGLMQRDGVFAEFARATFLAGGTDAPAVESDAAE